MSGRGVGDGGTARGITLPELLVVVCVIGLAITVALPSIREAVRSARGVGAANGFAVSLKAARMIAVTSRTPVSVRVFTFEDAEQRTRWAYDYQIPNGRLVRIELPFGVDVTETSSPIVFQATGGVGAPERTRFEVRLGNGRSEAWQVDTNALGLSTLEHTKGAPAS